MPNYPTHARWGQIGAAAMGVLVAATVYGLFFAPVLAFLSGIAAAATTFTGAIYPDIDHHKSIPRQKAVRAFRLLVALGIAALAGLGWPELVAAVESANLDLPVPPEAAAGGLVALVTIVTAGLVDPMIGLVTDRHRGWTHSVPINAVLIAVLLAGIWLLTRGFGQDRQITAVIVVGTFFVGTLIHLGLDGEIP
jgi:membrane-bound metal-dependent hydrolase YbcI (DUF457 family)